MVYLCLFPEIHPFLMVCLPWFTVMIRGSQDGGFEVEIEEPPQSCVYFPFPNQIAYVTFYADKIEGKYWRIPNKPEEWRSEIIAAWDELMERLKRGSRESS